MGRKEFILADTQVTSQPAVYSSTARLTARCHSCPAEITLTLAVYYNKRKNGPWSCKDCRRPEIAAAARANPLYRTPEYRKRFSDLHLDPEYHAKVHNQKVSNKISETMKEVWLDPVKRETHTAHRRTDESRQRISEWATAQWANPEYIRQQVELRNDPKYRERASQLAKSLWDDEEYRAKVTAVLNQARPNSAPKTNVSSLQLALYGALDSLGLDYSREGPDTVVGPVVTSDYKFEGYSFDCLVRHGGKSVYIECHGEYWHSGREARDAAKATFLTRYFPDAEILVIWEWEFRSPQRIAHILKRRFGLESAPLADFKLRDVEVAAREADRELKSLFATHHYLGNVGRNGSYRYGAVCGGKLVAAAVFSWPSRDQSAKRLGLPAASVLELSRFCVDPSYQRKNFASWFLGRAIKLLWSDAPKVRALLTFADTTYGHSGTIYKATNWIADGVIKPDYWYVDSENCWFHKKTVWDIACKNGRKEAEYAEEHGLRRVFGKEKLRFVLERPR